MRVVPLTYNPPSPINGGAEFPQQGGAQFQSNKEQHYDDAELGEVHDITDLSHQTQGPGTDNGLRRQVSQHRAQAEPLGDGYRYNRRSQIDEGLKEKAVTVHWRQPPLSQPY